MGGAVLVRTLQLQHDFAGGVKLEALIGNGRAGDVAASSSSSRYATPAFELLALISVTARPRMCP